jgi:hypothetical protein
MSTRLSRHGLFAVMVALVLFPVVVTVIAVIGGHWHPASDNALEVLRIRDVGGRHTPLTGPQSRFGWDHPGPLLFWLLAPALRIGGDSGVLVGVACINAAALVAALFLAHRRGGQSFAVLVAISLLLFLRAFGPSLLIDPWNPWVALLPFVVYMLLAWSVAERDFAALPWLVLVGSFLVQTHVGYLPLVVGVAVATAALAFVQPAEVRHRGRDASEPRALRRYGLIAVVVAVVAWFGPVLQQLRGHPDNLGDIVAYFRAAEAPGLGLSYGFGLLGRELPLAWVRGDDVGVLGFVIPASTIPSILLLAAALVTGVLAWRRGVPGACRLAILVVCGAIVGVFASARITGVAGAYLLRWWWVLGALLWCSLAWSAWCASSGTCFSAIARSRRWVAIAVLAAATALVAWDARTVRVPQQQFSTTLGRLGPPTRAKLSHDRRYLVRWIDTRDLGAVGVGMYLALAEHGFDARVERDFARPFGAWRVAAPGETDATIAVVSGDDLEGVGSAPGVEVLARYDPLDAAERQRARELVAAIRARLEPPTPLHLTAVDSVIGRASLIGAGADRADVGALAALRRKGLEYAVLLSPESNQR